jgi:hypothetical protein
MYAQVERSKENKSRAVANSVGQKKSSGKQAFGFVDNRIATTTQRKILQRVYDTGGNISKDVMGKVSEYLLPKEFGKLNCSSKEAKNATDRFRKPTRIKQLKGMLKDLPGEEINVKEEIEWYYAYGKYDQARELKEKIRKRDMIQQEIKRIEAFDEDGGDLNYPKKTICTIL